LSQPQFTRYRALGIMMDACESLDRSATRQRRLCPVQLAEVPDARADSAEISAHHRTVRLEPGHNTQAVPLHMRGPAAITQFAKPFAASSAIRARITCDISSPPDSRIRWRLAT
jgi:hypothetical protein